jgi:hypothetical protein
MFKKCTCKKIQIGVRIDRGSGWKFSRDSREAREVIFCRLRVLRATFQKEKLRA